MKYRVRHTTTYNYEAPVLHGRHMVRKRPRASANQQVFESSLSVDPLPAWTRESGDYFGNRVDVVELRAPHDRLVVSALTDIERQEARYDFTSSAFLSPWDTVRSRVEREPAFFEVRELLLDSPLVRRHPMLRDYALSTFPRGRPIVEALKHFNQRIFDEFAYDPNFSDISTPLGKVLREKRGVCQDFAHVFVGAMRSLGLPARYVSGYLETRPPPGQPRLVGADASHAWASVFIPDFGWLDFDPTNNVIPNERHIVVGWGRDFSEVSPLQGVVHGGGAHTVTVSVDVEPRPQPMAQSQQQSQLSQAALSGSSLPPSQDQSQN